MGGGAPMSASRPKCSALRRLRPGAAVKYIEVDFDDEEWAIVEARAAAAGLSVDEYAVMCVLEVKGNA
jgi:hypothetical protein